MKWTVRPPGFITRAMCPIAAGTTINVLEQRVRDQQVDTTVRKRKALGDVRDDRLVGVAVVGELLGGDVDRDQPNRPLPSECSRKLASTPAAQVDER
jgi:hypothetical protein